MRFRPLPVLTLLTIAALAVLAMFGRWQWDKYAAESAAQSTPLLEAALQSYEPLTDQLQLVYGVVDGEPGWRHLAPVRAARGVVFVDASFTPGVDPPEAASVAFPRALTFREPLAGVVVPVAPPGPFVSDPDVAARIWYGLDLPAMAAALGVEGAAETDSFIAIPYVGDDGRPVANPFAAAPEDATPPEQHLGYALTWWGLALVLIVVYVAFHMSAGRLRFRRARA